MSTAIRKLRIDVEAGVVLEVEGNRIGACVSLDNTKTILASATMTRDKVRELRDFLTGLLEDSGADSGG